MCPTKAIRWEENTLLDHSSKLFAVALAKGLIISAISRGKDMALLIATLPPGADPSDTGGKAYESATQSANQYCTKRWLSEESRYQKRDQQDTAKTTEFSFRWVYRDFGTHSRTECSVGRNPRNWERRNCTSAESNCFLMWWTTWSRWQKACVPWQMPSQAMNLQPNPTKSHPLKKHRKLSLPLRPSQLKMSEPCLHLSVKAAKLPRSRRYLLSTGQTA